MRKVVDAAPIRRANSFEVSAMTFVSDEINERPDEPRAPEEVPSWRLKTILARS